MVYYNLIISIFVNKRSPITAILVVLLSTNKVLLQLVVVLDILTEIKTNKVKKECYLIRQLYKFSIQLSFSNTG